MPETNLVATNAVAGVTNAVSGPVPSAPTFWESYGTLIISAVIVVAVFAYLWRKGHLARITKYFQETREELRKCTWPTREELKGSTVVISISILLLGGFTVVVDFVFSLLIRAIT